MRLSFRQIDALPRLAWCASLVEGHDTVEVLHGPWVETADGFFCEGAWSGPFASREIDSNILMGSGARVMGDTLMVSAPNHTLERLFVLRKRRTLLISNSFAFTLARAEDNVDPHALLYSVRLASIVNGLQEYARSLRTRDGHTLRLYYHCNLVIDTRLRVSEVPKQAAPDFRTFADYKTFLVAQISALHANATDPCRRVRYTPIATLSSGYDSPAAAVLARTVGCTEALTFSAATHQLDDSGEPIAARLGMKTHAFERLAYLRESGFPDAEFFGWGAQESPWAPHLEGRLVFTGFHGGAVWNRTSQKVGPHIVRGDASGHNLNAFRLRVGWIHLPVPFIGCTSHPSIHRLSNSEEMSPWRLRDHYDRPVPRRLIEEAGVERHLFAVKKKAAGVGQDIIARGLKARMTASAYNDYAEYHAMHWNRWMALKYRALKVLRALYLRHRAVNARVTAQIERLTGAHVELPILIPRNFRIGHYGDLDEGPLLMHWSITRILPQYAVTDTRPSST